MDAVLPVAVKGFDKTFYLKNVKPDDLEDKIARLDQLANFQTEIHFYPSDLKMMMN